MNSSESLPSECVKNLVTVVIPTWNGKHFLTGVLDSLAAQTYPQVEVIVVDNGSNDGSVEFMRENYPFVKLALYEKNTGFAVAVNRGIRESTGEFIALINNDTVLEADFIAELVKGMHEHPECGSLGCKMLAYDDHTLLDGVGDGYRRGGLPGRIGHREKDTGLFDQGRYILGACGGAALYRRSLFLDIGLFDDDYFAYLEDVDIALRAQSAGYKCFYIPTARIYHLGCGTTGSGYSPLVVKLSAQNNWNTIVKNVPLPLLLKWSWEIFFWQGYYLAVVCVRGGQVWPWIKGSFKALMLLPRMLAKRAAINKKRKVSLKYYEDVIVESENDLKAARDRLYKKKVTDSSSELSSSK